MGWTSKSESGSALELSSEAKSNPGTANMGESAILAVITQVQDL